MKKLDEIMELMADEMADFKASLLRLEELSKQLDELSVPISTEAIDQNLQRFLETQREAETIKDGLLKDINNQLRRASLIPKYILVLFGSCFLILSLLLGHFVYSNKVSEEQKLELYRSISESEIQSYHSYYSENPEWKDDYCEWLQQSHK
tara:strand:+ start:325 stop:777 length:453 start_codon:yes stop_codon:yes gene_type:complete